VQPSGLGILIFNLLHNQTLNYGFGGTGMGAPDVTFCFAASIFSATFLFSWSRARDFCQ